MRKARIKTVEDAAKALKVKDVSELTSDHATGFIQLMGRMDKDVAMQILKLCPDLIQITPEVVNAFERIGEEAQKRNDKSNESVMVAYQAIIDECKKELSKGKLSFRKKQKILTMMIDVADKMAEQDKENKKFVKEIHAKTAACGLAAIGAVAGIVAAVVFGQSKD